MAIAVEVDVKPAAQWPQGDIRDPLGVWGGRQGVTGDASGGGIKVGFLSPAGQDAAYVYTCYGVTVAQLTGTPVAQGIKIRLLTNWPDVDPLVGVQGFGSVKLILAVVDSDLSAPNGGVGPGAIEAVDRFLLLFDPRPSAGQITLVELEFGANVDGNTYSFESYGYFWDRSVLNAPGGPRHPGSGGVAGTV